MKLGEVYFGAGDYQDAATAFSRGIGKGQLKQLDEAYVSLGRSLTAEKDAPSAKTSFAKLKSLPNISPRVLKLWNLYADMIPGTGIRAALVQIPRRSSPSFRRPSVSRRTPSARASLLRAPRRECGPARTIRALARTVATGTGAGLVPLRDQLLKGASVRSQYGMRMKAANGLERLAAAGTIVIPGWDRHRCAGAARRYSSSALRRAGWFCPSVRVRSCWRQPVCSMAGKRPLTGVMPRLCSAGIPRSVSMRMSFTWMRAAFSPPPAAPRDSTSACISVRRDYGSSDSESSRTQAGHSSASRRRPSAILWRGPVEDRVRGADQRGSLAVLLDKIRKRPGERWRIAELARLAAMSKRTFMRRFRAATGLSPADWVTRARVDAARELLENTGLSIDRIAQRCGLGTPTTLRHHFRKKVGLSPTQYRKRFS